MPISFHLYPQIAKLIKNNHDDDDDDDDDNNNNNDVFRVSLKGTYFSEPSQLSDRTFLCTASGVATEKSKVISVFQFFCSVISKF